MLFAGVLHVAQGATSFLLRHHRQSHEVLVGELDAKDAKRAGAWNDGVWPWTLIAAIEPHHPGWRYTFSLPQHDECPSLLPAQVRKYDFWGKQPTASGGASAADSSPAIEDIDARLFSCLGLPRHAPAG
jgi:hypothetical protein